MGPGSRPSAKLSAHYANSVTGVASKTCIPYSQRGYFLFSPDLYRAAAERLKRERYDYIICDYGLAAVYGLLLSRRFRTPFIYSSHNIEYRANLGKAREDPRRWPLALYMYVAEKMAVKQARCVVAITPADADAYARWISARSHARHSGRIRRTRVQPVVPTAAQRAQDDPVLRQLQDLDEP